jgi:hypothetical protein
MMDRCHIHTDCMAAGTCRTCLQDFCEPCLVYAYGRGKSPYCVECALLALGTTPSPAWLLEHGVSA